MNQRIFLVALRLPLLVAALVGCSKNESKDEDPGASGSGTAASGGSGPSAGGTNAAAGGTDAVGGTNAGTNSGGGSSGEGGAGDDTPFDPPDTPEEYVPVDGDCGFEEPAFCETFEDGPQDGGR